MRSDGIAEDGAVQGMPSDKALPLSARTMANESLMPEYSVPPPEKSAGETGHLQGDAQMSGARRRQRHSRASGTDGVAAIPNAEPKKLKPRAVRNNPAQAGGEGAAGEVPTTGVSVPPLADEQPAAMAGGDRGARESLQPGASMPPVAVIVTRIRTLARERRYAIKQQVSLGNRLGGTVRSILGWQLALPEKKREAIRKGAAALIKSVHTDPPTDEPIDETEAMVARYVLVTDSAMAPFARARNGVEKAMQKAAQELPVWPWVKSVSGFGALGLAVIVGEAGDIGSYANPGKLWKRLGLAPVQKDGVTLAASSWRSKGGLSAEDWTKAGYSPHRRAELYAFIGDALLRAQWRAGKDGEPGHAIGPYGEAYAGKKAEYLMREGWTPKHADMAARRYMTKRVIRDLWRAWRAPGDDGEKRENTMDLDRLYAILAETTIQLRKGEIVEGSPAQELLYGIIPLTPVPA